MLTIMNGIFSLTFATICFLVGLTIASRYFKYKIKTFLFAGIAWMGLGEVWLGDGINFLVVLYTGKGLSPEIYVIITIVLIPFSTLAWMVAFTDLIMKEHQKIILILFFIYGIEYEIILIYLFSIDPDLVVVFHNPADAEYQVIIMVFIITYAIINLITGILFARESLKSDKPEIKLKGKFLLVAFLSCFIGQLLDGLLRSNIVVLTIARLILILSAFEFYYGFLLPNWMKKFILK